jgi:hypothetical protein
MISAVTSYIQARCRRWLAVADREPKNSTHTFEVFHDAVKNQCIICSVIWDMSYQYRHLWLESPHLWEPMCYTFFNYSAETIVILSVVYCEPLSDPLDKISPSASFHFIPVDGRFVWLNLGQHEESQLITNPQIPHSKNS